MSDKEFVIEMEDDTEGHGVRRAIIEPEESQWLEERLRRDNGKTNFRIVLRDEDEEDTEGHTTGTTLRLNLVDDDDTEGHAIAIHFPSRADADAFRRRLLVTGVLVGTVALGAAGGVGLSALQSDAGSGAAGVTQSQAYANSQEAAANEGARQGAATEAQRQAYANSQEAAANEGARQGAAAAADAQAYANYQEAAANEGARQGGGAAAQTGPMDVHEAPAFQSGAAPIDADRDLGIMDASGATRTGPMDVHEAPAFQSGGASSIDADRDIGIMDASGAAAGTQTGPMDVHEAPAFQNQSTDDDGSPELNDIGGPTPR